MIRFKKKTNEMLLFCSRCGHEASTLKEYLLHKKETHSVPIKETIKSLQIIGINDPELYQQLSEKYKNEKYTREYIEWCKEELNRIERMNK